MNDYARIGYEAYREASGGTTFDGRPMPTWDELESLPHGERTRKLWTLLFAAAIVTEAMGAPDGGKTPRCKRHPSWDLEMCGSCASEHVQAEMTGEACPHCAALPTQTEYDAETERLIREQERGE